MNEDEHDSRFKLRYIWSDIARCIFWIGLVVIILWSTRKK
jgi:hypothetical protein